MLTVREAVGVHKLHCAADVKQDVLAAPVPAVPALQCRFLGKRGSLRKAIRGRRACVCRRVLDGCCSAAHS